jgi:hypothetical protein
MLSGEWESSAWENWPSLWSGGIGRENEFDTPGGSL